MRAMSYGPQTTTDEVLDGVDLAGTVVVVTGASSGLGIETARALAAHGADVAMAVRDPARAADAVGTVGSNGHLVMLDGLGTSLGGFGVVVICNRPVIGGKFSPCDHFLQGTLGDLLFGIDSKGVAESNNHSQHRDDGKAEQ